ncbi:MMPL family transporter [Crossiella cryophila]|uniref:RND superfamily putative drug exporter n=1 Tax=Crossiella cryophila TaxID=43355 RepID=A0A7W7C3N3_9PSEU|nr:MMPL family transporter [Crossiella cryophila]MBB4673962.1 RND superfamily putative drug exporter [Crossiella cryophila]
MSRLRLVLPAFALLAWIVIGAVGLPDLGKLSQVQRNDNASFLPASAEATRAANEQKRFTEADVLPAVLVFERDSGLTQADQDAIARSVQRASTVDGLKGTASPVVPAPDGRAAQALLPVDGSDGFRAGETVKALRDKVREGLPGGLSAHVTGPAGIVGDFAATFGGIDGLLLGVTAAVVALILVLVYRSPLLPVVVLATAGLALLGAAAVVYRLARDGVLTLNGQSQGILFILVFGASTDYALLLVARYREELRQAGPRLAMRRAWRASLEPICASAGTVVLGMLCLLFSDLNSNKGLGPVAAIGIVASLLASLTFLPPALMLLGRSAFWPRKPAAAKDGIWGRVANLVGRRPRWTWVLTTAVLLFGVAFVPQLKADGVAQTDVFLSTVDSVYGQQALGRHFPGGSGSPAVIVTAADTVEPVLVAARGVAGVAEATALPKVVDGRVEINATLRSAADSEAAIEAVRALRTAVHAVPGASAVVGGPTAAQLDVQDTALRDRALIIPLVVLVILVVLALLLRSLLAPLLLMLTVVLSFAATLGVSALVFNHVFDFPGADPGVPLYAFVFLVALGIDYNIFLMTRVREEAARRGTEAGTLVGLSVTGGVITSAGVVLAATFAALAVLPILFLAQIAFLVAFGVLLDTLVVRSLLVPALAVDLGRAIWWPSRLSRPRPVSVLNDAAAARRAARSG